VGPNTLKPAGKTLRCDPSWPNSPARWCSFSSRRGDLCYRGEWTDAAIVVVIVAASAVLSFVQEYSASNAVEKLRTQVTIKAACCAMARRSRFLLRKWCR